MLADKLKALRDQEKMTNQQISDLSGVSLQTVTRIITGETKNPGFETVCDMIVAMGGSVDAFIGANVTHSASSLNDAIIHLYEKRVEDANRRADEQKEHAYIDKKGHQKANLYLLIMGIFVAALLLIDILMRDVGWIKY